MTFDYSDPPRGNNLIPDGTVATVQMHVRAGNAGEDGMLTRSKDGGSEYLDCEFVIIEGPYAKRKFWDRLILAGTTDGHAKAININRGTLKGILDSAFDLDPDDKSPEARARRTVRHKDFDGLNFLARIGIEKGKPKNDGSGELWPDKNILAKAITRGDTDWKGPIPQSPPFNGGDGGSVALPPEMPPASQPTSGITKPTWAT
jgi:hypothetical protein